MYSSREVVSELQGEKKLPLFGKLNIDNLDQFLRKSKTEFYDSLDTSDDLSSVRFEDFHLIRYLGRGTFATVYLVTSKKIDGNYALKLIKKSTVVQKKQVNHIRDEKMITKRLNFPFVIYFNFVFHDNSHIYFVMPFIPGGDLFDHLSKVRHFEEEQSKFIAAQVVLGIEYLHYLDIAYRDLKPENILIDKNGYIKLIDFTFAKILKEKTYTFCGTPEYIAPEVVMYQGYSLASDWWSFGVLLYELNAGHPPFRSHNQVQVYEKAVTMCYKCPRRFSCELLDLIANILQTNLTRRYGNLKNGVNDIKNHPWFRQTLWIPLLNRELQAPFVPNIKTASGDNNAKTCDGIIKPVVSDHNIYHDHFHDF